MIWAIATTTPISMTTLSWAEIPAVRIEGKPSFATVKTWIDNNRPFITLRPGKPSHFRVVDGYREIQAGGVTIQQVHVLDPLMRSPYPFLDPGLWRRWDDDPITDVWVGPSGPGGAPNVHSDEDEDKDGVPDTMDDSDGDGLVDFDERYCFRYRSN